MIELNNIESVRIYHLKDGGKIELKNITHFLSSKSTHRLKDINNVLYIVPNDVFNYIEIITKEFTI